MKQSYMKAGNKTVLGLGSCITLFIIGTVLMGMGNLNGVCISCAYEHGYGWQIEQAQNLQFFGFVIAMIASLILFLLVRYVTKVSPVTTEVGNKE